MSRPLAQRVSTRSAILVLLSALFLCVALPRLCLAEELASTTAASPKKSPIDDYISVALKAASGIGALLAIMKGISELSVKARKHRRIERIMRMATFAKTTARLSASEQAVPELSEAKNDAERELKEGIARLYAPPKPLSRWRRLLLIYVPQGFRQYISHFFFYLLVSTFGYGVFAITEDIFDSSFSEDEPFLLLILGSLVVLCQRWGALEWRIRNKIRLEPRRIFGKLFWYPPNSFLGWLAHVYLFWAVWDVIDLFLPSFSDGSLSSDRLFFPAWQLPIRMSILSFLIPVACFWPAIEFRFYCRELVPIRLKTLWVELREWKSPERIAGILAFVLMTLWVIVLCADFFRLPIVASAPDGPEDKIGWATAVTDAFINLFVLGVLPWIPVYRGLSALLAIPKPDLEEMQSDWTGRVQG